MLPTAKNEADRPHIPWWRRRAWTPSALVLAGIIPGLVAGVTLGKAWAGKPKQRKSPYRKLVVFARVLSYVENEYVVPVNRDRIIEDSIRGLIRGLDPHTQFFSASQVKRLRSMLTGRYSGVGITLTRRQGQVIVLAAAPGGPAERAGIRAGDLLVAIDNHSVRQWDLPRITTHLRGRRGTRVKLTIQPRGPKRGRKPGMRGKRARPRTLSLVRDTIRSMDVLKGSVGHGVGLVQVRRFSHGSARGVIRAIGALRKAEGGKLRGLVLDLRNNPGGLMDEGIRLADHFLAKGLIVRKVGKRGRLRESEFAHSKGTLTGVPMVVLINQGTASASEIVAAALRDHRRATLLGERSFGKGSMQSIIPLPDGSRLKLTIARYFRPSGKAIAGRGVQPHVRVTGARGGSTPPTTALSAPSRAVKSVAKMPGWVRRDAALRRGIRLLRKAPRPRP
jgi:carboxyl-terminal processing protease